MVGTPTQEQLDGIRSDSTQWDAKAKRVVEVGESGESVSDSNSQRLVTDRTVKELIQELIIELKKVNIHLQSITDEKITPEDTKNDN